MPTKELVTKVWIAPGCIVCDACETASPEVFQVLHDEGTCIIRPDALNMEFTKPLTDSIIQAAAECPVDVIKFDKQPFEVSEEEAAKTAAPAPVASAAASHSDGGHGPTADKAPGKKLAEPPKPKTVDPAIQALLAATMVRGGNVVIDRGVKGMPDSVKQAARMTSDELPPDGKYQRVLEKTKPVKEEPSRRNVLLWTAWGTFGVAAGALPGLAFARFMAPNVLEQEDPKVRCGPLAKYLSLAPGDVNEDYKPVKPSGFWIIREEDRLSAVSIICTHLGCIPSWLPNDRKFKCPCHGSGFKPNGTNFEGPAPRPLERFMIYLDGDEVIVDRSRKFLAMGPNDTGPWNDPDASIAV